MTSKALQQLVTDFVEGVEIKDRTWRFQTFRRCFVASEAVDWFLDSGYARSRSEAVQKGNLLLFHKIFQHVTNSQPFKDDYLFFSLRPDVHVYTGYGRMLVRFVKGVELKDRWYRFWKYRKCFSGRDAVAWLLENGHASDLSEALMLGKTMIDHRVFEEYRGYRAEFRNSDSVFFQFTKEAYEFVERSKTCRMQRHPRSFSSVYSHPSVCSVSGGYYGEKNIDEEVKDTLFKGEKRCGRFGRPRSASQGSDSMKHRRTHSESLRGLVSSTSAKEESSTKRVPSSSALLTRSTNSVRGEVSGKRIDDFVRLTRTQCVRRALFCCEMAHVALGQNADHQAALHLTRAQTWANLALSSSTAANMHDPDASVKPTTGTNYNTFPKKVTGTYNSTGRGTRRWSPELRALKSELAELRERLKRTSVPGQQYRKRRTKRKHSERINQDETKTDEMDPDTIQRLYGGKNGVLSDSELEILMRGSHVPGGAVIQPWLHNDIKTDFAQGVANSGDARCCFVDKFGELKLSTRQRLRFGAWRRPSEFLEQGVVPQMIQLVSPLTIKQDVVGDCSFVSSLCVAAAYERRFDKQILTSCIYPQDRNGRPIYNPFGKYIFRFHFNGIPRKVVIDDMLPVDRRGNLLCACSTLRGELWVSLLEKAYMKLQGGYQFSGGNSGIDLHAMTGWIPEMQQVDLSTFNAKRTWKRMLNGHNSGLCLVTIGTPEMSEEEELRYGLVSNHAYALLEIREVSGHQMLKLKNPWRHSRWRGKFSAEDSESWTEELREKLKFDDVYGSSSSGSDSSSIGDDGVFWIDYESLQQRFSFLFMNWKPRLFPVLQKLHGCWKADAAGPRDDSYNLGFNPQYVLNIEVGPRRRPAALWMLLSQHKNKTSSKTKIVTTSSAVSSSYASTSSFSEDFGIRSSTASFLTLHVYSGKQGRVIGTIDRDALLRTAYTDNPHTLVRFYVPPGVHSFALVLSQWEHRHDIDYTLAVFSMVTCTLDIMPDMLKPKLHLPFYFLTLSSSHNNKSIISSSSGGSSSKEEDESRVQVSIQWELIFSNVGEPTSFMLYLEEASDDRIVSYPLHVHTSPVLKWSSSNSNYTSIETFQEMETEMKDQINKDIEESNITTMIRLELFQKLQGDDRTLVGSSGDFRPRFCYLDSRNISTKRRYVVVASYMTTKRDDSKEMARRFVLRLGIREGIVRTIPIPPEGHDMSRLEFKGSWSFERGTAAGSRTFGRYHSNPSILFRLRKPGRVTFRLVSLVGGQNKNLAINLSLYRCVAPNSKKKKRHARVRRRNTEPALDEVGGSRSENDVRLQIRDSAHVLRSSLGSKTMSRLFDNLDNDVDDDDKDDDDMPDKMKSRLLELLATGHSEKDRAFTLSYVRLRDVLVDEFGSKAFDKAKTSIQMAMQGCSGIVTGEVVATSCNGMYSTNSNGVAVSNVKLEMSHPYIALVSTFEPLEGRFRLIMYTENESCPDIIQHDGMEMLQV